MATDRGFAHQQTPGSGVPPPRSNQPLASTKVASYLYSLPPGPSQIRLLKVERPLLVRRPVQTAFNLEDLLPSGDIVVVEIPIAKHPRLLHKRPAVESQLTGAAVKA